MYKPLNIVFICGCLESSKDGVGDYIFIFAKQLVQLGHNCICVSLNDKYVKSTPKSSPVLAESDGVLFVRFGCNITWKDKLFYIRSLVKEYNVAIFSLQFVPYAYSSKGLPFQLLFWLPLISKDIKWHVMCHELWVDKYLKKSNILLALLQKILLLSLLRLLNPIKIHTTNHFYQKNLSLCGFESSVLPLSSNIHFVNSSSIRISESDRWDFIFFGSLHKEWQSNHFFECLEHVRCKNKISDCRFTLIGRAGAYGQELWAQLVRKYPKYVFINLGECSNKDISLQLQYADFGVTTTPSHLIEKSGTVSAMLSHGLPIIIPRVTNYDPEWNRKLKMLPEYILLDDDFEMRIASATKFAPRSVCSTRALDFISSVQDSI
jgi:hypothetical protein